jgi:hypothetical protein
MILNQKEIRAAIRAHETPGQPTGVGVRTRQAERNRQVLAVLTDAANPIGYAHENAYELVGLKLGLSYIATRHCLRHLGLSKQLEWHRTWYVITSLVPATGSESLPSLNALETVVFWALCQGADAQGHSQVNVRDAITIHSQLTRKEFRNGLPALRAGGLVCRWQNGYSVDTELRDALFGQTPEAKEAIAS